MQILIYPTFFASLLSGDCSKIQNRTGLGLFYSLTLENQTRKRAPHFT